MARPATRRSARACSGERMETRTDGRWAGRRAQRGGKTVVRTAEWWWTEERTDKKKRTRGRRSLPHTPVRWGHLREAYLGAISVLRCASLIGRLQTPPARERGSEPAAP